MTSQPRTSDSRVWVNPETGGVESTAEWQRRFNSGDPEAHRQLAALCSAPAEPVIKRRHNPRGSLADLTTIEITEPVSSPSDVLLLADKASKLAYAQLCGLRDLLEQGRSIVVDVGVLT